MKKALFLDIDGVLQPCGEQERFRHMNEIPDICAHLNETIDTDFDYEAYANYSYSNKCDIGAVYFDWDKDAVERLRRILDATGARIVLSSDWREGGMGRMRGFLAIYGLDKYLEDATFCILDSERHNLNDYTALNKKIEDWRNISQQIDKRMRELYPGDPNRWFDFVDSRTSEIREYLDRHPEITSFIALDDRNLTRGLDGHFIQTKNRILEEYVEPAIEILNREDGPFFFDESIHTPELEEWRRKYIK
ncbi:HAD domain-containing protein [Bacteroidaceae bacterium]|jgi:hypothetical protein|nr:hypothetical protein [Bacteroides sp.]